jgi:hypothetical protein
MSFAIPSIELKALLGVLYTRRYVLLPLLGLKQEVTTSNVREYFGIPPSAGGSNQSGLLVDHVMPQSLLSMAGVQPGDVLLTLDGASVDRFSQVWVDAIDDRVHLDTFLARKEFYQELQLEVWRGSATPDGEAGSLDLTVPYDSTPALAVPTIPETVGTPPQHVSIGGIAMMNLTSNLVEAFVNSKTARFLDPSECMDEHLLIVDVVAESPAGLDGTVGRGHLVQQINGIMVSNIQQACNAMTQPQGDWMTIHTDRGMLIMSNDEMNAYECGPMGYFPNPNQLCAWACPEPEPAEDPSATMSSLVSGLDGDATDDGTTDDGTTADDGTTDDDGSDGGSDGGSDDGTTDDDGSDGGSDDGTTDDDGSDGGSDGGSDDGTADDDGTDNAAATQAANTPPEAAAGKLPKMQTLGLPLSTKPTKHVNPAVNPKAPAAVKAFKSKIQMVLP